MNILFVSFVLLFQTIKGSELLAKKEEVNKALPIKGIRPGANLWSDEAVEIATRGPQNIGYADVSQNQVRKPIGYWEQPSLPKPSLPSAQLNTQNRPHEPQSFPSVGSLGNNRQETQSLAAKDKGWISWNNPQWGSESNDDWTNSLSDSPSFSPSLMLLPQQSWTSKEIGKFSSGDSGVGYGGKNSWSLPNLPDPNHGGYGWNDQSSSDLLPPPASPLEQESHNWREPQWSLPQSDNLINSLEPIEHEWNPSASHWTSPSLSQNNNNNNNQKGVCVCEPGQTRGIIKEQSSFNTGSLSNLPSFYPDYSSQNSYAPIRPNKPQKQSSWNHWDLPWNTWEKGAKEGKHKLKPTEVEENDKEAQGKTENEQEAETETENENASAVQNEEVQNKEEIENGPEVESL